MIKLTNEKTGELIGEITEQQLSFLEDQFEEESTQDQDYSITPLELAYFEEIQADPALVTMLKGALGDQPELIILWSRE